VLEADIVLHVRDIAHDESEAQKTDVLKVLAELGMDESARPIIEVLNKIDLLPPEVRTGLLARNLARPDGPIAVSALTGDGLDALKLMLERLLGSNEQVFRLKLDHADGAGLAWAYAHGRVRERRNLKDGFELIVAVSPEAFERFTVHFPQGITLIEENQRLKRSSSRK
jgi:GTP-binding protein HflX